MSSQQKTTVINVRSGEPFDVYIGRKVPGHRASKWANPFRIGQKHPITGLRMTRHEVMEQFRRYILERPDLLAELSELRGKRLGCWCVPRECHGHILAELADQA